MTLIPVSCIYCNNEFAIDTSARQYTYCPYCGKVMILPYFETQGIKRALKKRKNPLETWAMAEKLQHIVEVEKVDDLKDDASRKEYAKSLGISYGTLYQYLRAVNFANTHAIDKSKLSVTAAYELSRVEDYDILCEMLAAEGKDIYSATTKEIREIANDQKNFEKNGFDFSAFGK